MTALVLLISVCFVDALSSMLAIRHGGSCLFVLIRLVLNEEHFDGPVHNDEHVDVQIDDCVRKQLEATIPEMSRKDTEDDAKDEEKVYHMACAVRHLASGGDLLVPHSVAANAQSNRELTVVPDE